ncbi:MAG: hypothetical protein ACOC0P_00970, partial [Planctomycetota bacterium]
KGRSTAGRPELLVTLLIRAFTLSLVAGAASLVSAPVFADRSTAEHQFLDVTDAVGLGSDVVGTGVARCLFADLNNDGWPDVVLDRVRVFLNRPAAEPAAAGVDAETEAEAEANGGADEGLDFGSLFVDRTFVEVESPGLPTDGGNTS